MKAVIVIKTANGYALAEVASLPLMNFETLNVSTRIHRDYSGETVAELLDKMLADEVIPAVTSAAATAPLQVVA